MCGGASLLSGSVGIRVGSLLLRAVGVALMFASDGSCCWSCVGGASGLWSWVARPFVLPVARLWDVECVLAWMLWCGLLSPGSLCAAVCGHIRVVRGVPVPLYWLCWYGRCVRSGVFWVSDVGTVLCSCARVEVCA